MSIRFFDRLLHWLALLGFTIHESKTLAISESDRQWGEEHHGFALSAYWRSPDLVMALKNTGAGLRTLELPDWHSFFHIRASAATSEYAKRLTASSKDKPTRKVVLQPGELVEADLPLERLLDLKKGQPYNIVVSCDLGITSNPVEIIL